MMKSTIHTTTKPRKHLGAGLGIRSTGKFETKRCRKKHPTEFWGALRWSSPLSFPYPPPSSLASSRRCLVTGGAGFIGSNLVDALLKAGHHVTVLDRFSGAKQELIKKWSLYPGFSAAKGDICDVDLVESACANIDWVFHFAGLSGIQQSIQDPISSVTQNCSGTTNVLESARKLGVKKFVYSSSSSSYGAKNSQQLLKDGVAFTESLPSHCDSPYALGKRFGEEMTLLYGTLHKMQVIVLRYFNVYGPNQRPFSTVVDCFMRQWKDQKPFTIVGDGTQRRDYVHVRDVVDANIKAAESTVSGHIINIGCGKSYSLLEVAALIDSDRPISFLSPRPGEYPATLADISTARSLLNWSPSIGLREGIAELKELTQRNGV